MFDKKDFTEDNLIINCKPEGKTIECSVAQKNGEITQEIGTYIFEPLGKGRFNILTKPVNLTVKQDEEIQEIIKKKYLPI